MHGCTAGEPTLVPHSAQRRASRPYLDSGHESEVADENDAQLCGHVLHYGPALTAQACGRQQGYGASTWLLSATCLHRTSCSSEGGDMERAASLLRLPSPQSAPTPRILLAPGLPGAAITVQPLRRRGLGGPRAELEPRERGRRGALRGASPSAVGFSTSSLRVLFLCGPHRRGLSMPACHMAQGTEELAVFFLTAPQGKPSGPPLSHGCSVRV